MRDNKIVVGFIGNGKSCHRYNAPFILRRPDKYIIKTIYGRSEVKEPWTKIEGVNYTNNLDDILKDSEIDLVIISLPHHLHFEYSKLALENGKNVVCEKPFVETEEEAKELYKLSYEKGLTIQAYQNRRFDSDFLTVQKVIESGKLGEVYEIEMGFDYYRPEVPLSVDMYYPVYGMYYGHGCHTIDQVLSYFGTNYDKVVYDVRQLTGNGRMNDYFDIDMFYGNLKVSIKSSYFRIKERPSFTVYGKKGMFVKKTKDKMETHLKMFYGPEHKDFGLDTFEEYGVLTYVDDLGEIHEEKVKTVEGDYAYYYDALYETIVNKKEKLVKDEETLTQLRILQEGIKGCK